MAPTCKTEVVSGDYGGQTVLLVQSRNQFKNQLAGVSVEVARRLIRQQDLGLGDERASEGETLLLAAGKLAGAMVTARFQSNLAQPARSLWFCGR